MLTHHMVVKEDLKCILNTPFLCNPRNFGVLLPRERGRFGFFPYRHLAVVLNS